MARPGPFACRCSSEKLSPLEHGRPAFQFNIEHGRQAICGCGVWGCASPFVATESASIRGYSPVLSTSRKRALPSRGCSSWHQPHSNMIRSPIICLGMVLGGLAIDGIVNLSGPAPKETEKTIRVRGQFRGRSGRVHARHAAHGRAVLAGREPDDRGNGESGIAHPRNAPGDARKGVERRWVRSWLRQLWWPNATQLGLWNDQDCRPQSRDELRGQVSIERAGVNALSPNMPVAKHDIRPP